MNIGKRIKQLREEKGFSQSSVAKYLGISQKTFSKIEKGNHPLSSGTLKRISDLFGVEAKALVDGSAKSTQMICALDTKALDDNDLAAIAAVNRIALNANFLSKLS